MYTSTILAQVRNFNSNTSSSIMQNLSFALTLNNSVSVWACQMSSGMNLSLDLLNLNSISSEFKNFISSTIKKIQLSMISTFSFYGFLYHLSSFSLSVFRQVLLPLAVSFLLSSRIPFQKFFLRLKLCSNPHQFP